MKIYPAIISVLLGALCGFANAADDTPFATQGKLLYELPLGVVPKGWIGFGKQELVEDVWQISEKPEDHHPAAPKMPTPAQNLIAEWEWRVPAAQNIAFRFDTKGGHLCNVTWSPAADGKPGRVVLAMQDYDGETGPAKPEWLDSKPFPTPRDQWVKVRWEMIGGEVRVRIGDLTLRGQRDAIALPKTTVAFPVTGGAAQVRGLKIWEASRAK